MVPGTQPIVATVVYSPMARVTGYLAMVIYDEEPFIVLTELEEKLVLLPLEKAKVRGKIGHPHSACTYDEPLFVENVITVDRTDDRRARGEL